jgi:hypothetical protein
MTKVEKNVNNEKMGQYEGPHQGPIVEIQGFIVYRLRHLNATSNFTRHCISHHTFLMLCSILHDSF